MTERKCDARCWWAKGKKCRCKCEGKQHGILRDENKAKFDYWVEEEAKIWSNRLWIREREGGEVEI